VLWSSCIDRAGSRCLPVLAGKPAELCRALRLVATLHRVLLLPPSQLVLLNLQRHRSISGSMENSGKLPSRSKSESPVPDMLSVACWRDASPSSRLLMQQSPQSTAAAKSSSTAGSRQLGDGVVIPAIKAMLKEAQEQRSLLHAQPSAADDHRQQQQQSEHPLPAAEQQRGTAPEPPPPAAPAPISWPLATPQQPSMGAREALSHNAGLMLQLSHGRAGQGTKPLGIDSDSRLSVAGSSMRPSRPESAEPPDLTSDDRSAESTPRAAAVEAVASGAAVAAKQPPPTGMTRFAAADSATAVGDDGAGDVDLNVQQREVELEGVAGIAGAVELLAADSAGNKAPSPSPFAAAAAVQVDRAAAAENEAAATEVEAGAEGRTAESEAAPVPAEEELSHRALKSSRQYSSSIVRLVAGPDAAHGGVLVSTEPRCLVGDWSHCFV